MPRDRRASPPSSTARPAARTTGARQFPEVPSEAALEKLASLPPREMRRALQSAFGNAKLAGRSEVSADDVQDPRAGRRQRIGF